MKRRIAHYFLFLTGFFFFIYPKSTLAQQRRVHNGRGLEHIKHIVSTNDIYRSLSRIYNVDVESIKSVNRSRIITTGDTIIIPRNSTPQYIQKGRSFIDDEGPINIQRDTVIIYANDFVTSTPFQVKSPNNTTNSTNLVKPTSLTNSTTSKTQNVSETPSSIRQPLIPIDKISQFSAHIKKPEARPVYIKYKVKRRDTWTSIARKLNTSVSNLKQLNKDIKRSLKPKESIVVKIIYPNETPNSPELSKQTNKSEHQEQINNLQEENSNEDSISPPPSTTRLIVYKVKKGENLGEIASRFDVDEEKLIKLNRLKSKKLAKGQRIKIEIEKITSVQDENNDEVINKTPISPPIVDSESTSEEDSLQMEQFGGKKQITTNRYGLTEVHEKGIALWTTHPLLTEGKSYAIHKNAPIGTVMKVTLPRTKRSVFVKVIGNFTETPKTKGINIILSQTATLALGLLTPETAEKSNNLRFIVNITYGTSK